MYSSSDNVNCLGIRLYESFCNMHSKKTLFLRETDIHQSLINIVEGAIVGVHLQITPHTHHHYRQLPSRVNSSSVHYVNIIYS